MFRRKTHDQDEHEKRSIASGCAVMGSILGIGGIVFGAIAAILVVSIPASVTQAGAAASAFPRGAQFGQITPTPLYRSVNTPYIFVMTQTVGNLTAGTRVSITSRRYNGSQWTYRVVAPDGRTRIQVLESQLAYAPGATPFAPTPRALYQRYIGMNVYWFVTKEQIGNIPPQTRVRFLRARYGANGWIYTISTINENMTAEVTEAQLEVAPGIVLGAPTPTMRFQRFIGNYSSRVVIREQVGKVLAGTRAWISGARFNGQEWVYQVFPDGQDMYFEVRESQLDFAPVLTPTPFSRSPRPTIVPPRVITATPVMPGSG